MNITTALVNLLHMLTLNFFRSDPMAEPVNPVTPPSGDQRLDVVLALFDAAVGLCPNDWADRQIRKAQGAFVFLWPTITTIVPQEIGNLQAWVDAALLAASMASPNPIVKAVLNIARGIFNAAWEGIFPKAQAALASKGVKV